jgi:DnaJ-class molecular chaperone
MPKPIYPEEECPLCDGKGTKDPECVTCMGKGRIKVHDEWMDCPDCENEPCDMCGGYLRHLRRRF